MPVRDRRTLAQAFAQTSYRGVVAGEPVELRVGQACPLLDSRLGKGLGWVWLTAVNPGAQMLPAVDNTRRLAALGERLSGAGIEFWPGEAVADDGSWPAEAGYLVINLPLDAARAIAMEFGQAAILWSDGVHPVHLEWLASP